MSVRRRRIAVRLSSGPHPPGYWKAYYQKNRERIIRSIVDSRRRRRAANRARLEAAGLLPLPPEYHQQMLERARVTRFINRLANLDDLPFKDEEKGDRAR